jgi:hypothetical protein
MEMGGRLEAPSLKPQGTYWIGVWVSSKASLDNDPEKMNPNPCRESDCSRLDRNPSLYWLNYLTPQSRILIEKMAVAQ